MILEEQYRTALGDLVHVTPALADPSGVRRLLVLRTVPAAQLGAVAWAIEHVGRPDSVEILIDEAGCRRIVRIESLIGGDVREGERQRSPLALHIVPQEQVERDRPA